MLRIGVISDTHVPDRQESIPPKILDGLKGVDLIIHAGDLTSLNVLEVLRKIAPVEAVHGNMDTDPVRSVLEPVKTMTVGGKKIAIMHGGGSPDETIRKARTGFSGSDCVIFGHTHRPFSEYEGKALIFNPGSACGGWVSPASYGILYIDEKDESQPVRGEILFLN